MKQEMVMVPKQHYEKLKMQAEVDMEILTQLMGSFMNIKEGRIRRVK